jgi:hypothetical protein
LVYWLYAFIEKKYFDQAQYVIVLFIVIKI